MNLGALTGSVCRIVAVAIAAAWLVLPARLTAQLLKAEAPIRVGHYHLNVTSIDEHKKFWVDALGGTATKVGSTEAVRFGDVFLLLRQQKPTGPTRGTTFDHIGFAVPNVPEFAKQRPGPMPARPRRRRPCTDDSNTWWDQTASRSSSSPTWRRTRRPSFTITSTSSTRSTSRWVAGS